MFHLIVKNTRNSKPVTKTGRDVPINTNIVAPVSTGVFFIFAANTPRPTPIINQIINAPIASESVIGSASFSISVTHALSLNEYPKLGAGQLNAASPIP